MCFDIGVVTCGPSEAIIISGVGYDQPCVIVGGRSLVCPCLQMVQRLSLQVMTLVIESPRVYTKQGVSISVHGVAQVKISGSNDEMLRYNSTLYLMVNLRHNLSTYMFVINFRTCSS